MDSLPAVAGASPELGSKGPAGPSSSPPNPTPVPLLPWSPRQHPDLVPCGPNLGLLHVLTRLVFWISSLAHTSLAAGQTVEKAIFMGREGQPCLDPRGQEGLALGSPPGRTQPVVSPHYCLLNPPKQKPGQNVASLLSSSPTPTKPGGSVLVIPLSSTHSPVPPATASTIGHHPLRPGSGPLTPLMFSQFHAFPPPSPELLYEFPCCYWNKSSHT